MHPSSLALAAVLLTTLAPAQQLPCWNTDIGASLGLTDETMSLAMPLGFSFPYGGNTYTHIQVCDNGYITLGASGGAADWNPSAATLTGDPFPRICPLWTDLEPGLPGSGTVHFQAVAANGSIPAHAIITWLDCFEFFGSTPHTFQVVLQDGGAIRCSYRDDLLLNTSPWLIGASPANGAAQNPVSFSALPIATAGNATLHEVSTAGAAVPLADSTIDWTPDGTGGYIVTASPNCADFSYYGQGCVARHRSFYEWFQNTPAIDLSNTAIHLAFTGSSYDVSAATTAFVTPTPAAANLNLSNDSETVVTLASPLLHPDGSATTLVVGSNGYVSVASNGAALDYTPTPWEFLGWQHASWAVWRDLIPGTGGGDVWFEEIGNLSILTWLNVLGYQGQVPGTTPSTFQLQFDRTTGDVWFVFGPLDTQSVNTWPGGEGWVVGYTPDGPSLDPGSTDLSAALASGSLMLDPADQAPLTLTISGPPSINSTIDLVVSEIGATAAFGGILFGLQKIDPPLSLASLGMPECFQHTNQLSVLLFFPSGAATQSVPFAVPNFPSLPVYVQAAVYDPASGQTALGATSSNAARLFTGL